MAYQRLDITDGKTTLVAAQVSHIEDGIIENESNIASNAEKISQNADDIAQNAEDIAKHTEEISTINSDLSVTSDGNWKYRIMGGYADLWANISFSDVGSNSYSAVAGWYYSDQQSVTLPLTLSDVVVTAVSNNRAYVSNFGISSGNTLAFRLIIMNSMSDSYNVQFNIHGKVS